MTVDKESYLRDFLRRQKDIHNRSLQAVADLAQANTELIAMAGLAGIEAKKALTEALNRRDDGDQPPVA